jgi:2-polyprenyl-3-methyl-5-hydroxy-6-metoxy-1,4-benzoquinol methylase
VLDLACGTGEISIRLAEKGCEVTGIDDDYSIKLFFKTGKLSHILPEKKNRLSRFFLLGTVICCDSLNYLKTKNDVLSTFKSVFQVLKEDGLLLKTGKLSHILPEKKNRLSRFFLLGTAQHIFTQINPRVNVTCAV